MPDTPSRSCARPGGVALARVDDRAREVVRERGRLAAARPDRAQRHGRVRRRRRRVRVQRRDRRGAVQRVAVGGAVELDRAADDPGPGRRTGVRPAGRRSPASCPASVSPSRLASCLSGRIATRLPPPLTQPVSVVTCAAVSGVFAEHDDVELGEQRRREERHVDRRERVQALVPAGSRRVQRRTGSPVEPTTRMGGGEASVVKRPGRVGGKRVAGEVGHAAGAALDRDACTSSPYSKRALRRQRRGARRRVVGDRRRHDGVERVLQLEASWR